jgi:diguanylate cyclase (GGDEF)-like protein
MIADTRFHIDWARGMTEGRERLAQASFDICILNLANPDGASLELLASTNTLLPTLPIIALAESPTPEQDRQAQSLGAAALLEKDKLDPASLGRTIRYAIHQRKAITNMARHAFVDEPTGLISPALLRERLERALAFARRRDREAAVMIIDLDLECGVELKDSLVDQALRVIGQRLSAELRETDSIARLSKQRLALLIEGTSNLDQIATVARKVMRRLRSPIEIESLPISPAPSMGVAIYPSEGGDGDRLIREAETAMRRALAEGGGCFRFSSERIDHAANEGLVLSKAFASAFGHRELRLRYYPDIALTSGMNGLGCEVAWRHPDKDWLLLGSTFASLEDETLIKGVADWALASAAEQLSIWNRLDINFRHLSLALPFHRSPTLALLREAVMRQLKARAISPEMIELDLPASLIIDDVRRGGSDLAALKATGVRLAFDGFGDGRFAIDDLQQHALDSIKLTPSLCADLPNDQRHVSALRALINLGHDLGLGVTAKGARDQRQFSILKRLGCDSVQLSNDLPPMSADAASVWLRTTGATPADDAPMQPVPPEILVPGVRSKGRERVKAPPRSAGD